MAKNRWTWMRSRLEAMRLKPVDMTRALRLENRPASTAELLSGRRALQPGEYIRAARFFKLDLQTVVTLETGENPDLPKISEPPTSHGMNTEVRSLAVWKSAAAKEGRYGGFVLHSDKAANAGQVRRPDFLDTSEKAFAFKVVDNSHADRYMIRDIALVDPEDPVTQNDDCLFTNENRLHEDAECIIGTLIREDVDGWVIRQGSKGEDRTLPKSIFPNAWLIVGRYHKR